MTQKEYIRICAQLAVVQDVLNEYGNRTLDNAIQTLKSRKEWCEKHNPCNSCTEKVPLTSLSPGWHHDCEICYNGSFQKMRHYLDVEYREEIKKYRKD